MDAVNRAGIYRFYTKPWDDRAAPRTTSATRSVTTGRCTTASSSSAAPTCSAAIARHPVRLTLGTPRKADVRIRTDMISEVHVAATLGSHGSHRCAGAAADAKGFHMLASRRSGHAVRHLALIAVVAAATVAGTAVTPAVADHGDASRLGHARRLAAVRARLPRRLVAAVPGDGDAARRPTAPGRSRSTCRPGRGSGRSPSTARGTAATRRPTCRSCSEARRG